MSNQEINPQREERPPYYDEKTEEKLEKETEKHEEKHSQDTLSSLSWAMILIWIGLVLLAANLGWLNQIPEAIVLPEGIDLVGLSTWSVIFLGAGVILVIEALIRFFVPAYRSSTGGNFFLAAIFLGIGLSGIFGWDIVWPIIVIALGLSTLAKALLRKPL